MADKLNGLIISEILADNAGNSATDVDGDGSANKADEFVEIQNTTGSAISLDGFELWSEKVGLLYNFGAADTIAAGGTATLLGEYTGTPPAGFYGATTNNGINWLPDGEGQKFDSIFLVNSATGEYVVLSYGNPPRAPTLPTNFPGTTRIGAGEQIDSSSPNGIAFARDTSGDFVETTPTPGTSGPPCFGPDTFIETTQGAINVARLRPGAKLLTLDAGPNTLLGIRQFSFSPSQLLQRPEWAPLMMPRGFMGATEPLVVSPNHQFLVRSKLANLLFESSEVFVAAKHFKGFGVERVRHTTGPFTYFHLLLEHHQIIMTHGLWSESLFLGAQVIKMAEQQGAWDCLPGVDPATLSHPETARPVLSRYEARLLLDQDPPSRIETRRSSAA